MDSEKKKTIWGDRFWRVFLSLGPLLGHFAAILSPPGSRGPKREAQEQPKGGQEPPKSRPRATKRGPGEAKRVQRVPRRAQERPREQKTGQESPQRETKRAHDSLRGFQRETKREKKSENKDPTETQRDQEGRHERPEGRHKREIKKKRSQRGLSQRGTGDTGKRLAPQWQEESLKGNPEAKEKEARSKQLAA